MQRIWEALRRPLEPHGAVEAILGLRTREARQFVSTTIAGSDEASALIDAMPQLIRGLSISTISVPERSVGQVRGPILWSETLAARASAAGDPGIFVCATARRAYDTDDNRILVLALNHIKRGGRDVEHLRRVGETDLERFAAARRNGQLANKFLEHRALSSVTLVSRPGRTLQRVRSRRGRDYAPALAMLQRAAEPLSPADLRAFCDARTTAQHDLLAAVLDQLGRLNVRVGPLTAVEGELRAGALRYRHFDCHHGDGPGGVFLGRVHLDVPGDSDGTDAHIVQNRGDIARAVEEAVTRGEI